jgi:hypothetical protein
LQLAAAVESPAAAYLAKNNDKFKQLLNTVGVNDKAISAMHGILLAPSNTAVDAFVSSMDGMTLPELLKNKLLVDQATAYHFLPGVRVTPGLKVPNMPLTTKTGNASLPRHCSHGTQFIVYVVCLYPGKLCPTQHY